MNAPGPTRASESHGFWAGKRVFMTGHTGFKGGWLTLWLRELGAIVKGFSLEPPTQPNLFTLASVPDGIEDERGDIRDAAALLRSVDAFRPDVIFHLAAQPLVRASYDDPVATFATNVMGTVNLLEAARRSETARATLVVTTDKCYENREQIWPYREIDAMGGRDPYSGSKGCAELAVASYGRSFFSDGPSKVASLRAGNVIGGGDWAKDRLIVDILAALDGGTRPVIRNPRSVRPWQHVLEPLGGYLKAAEHLWTTPKAQPEAWNFGPGSESEISVAEVVELMSGLWDGEAQPIAHADPGGPHEAGWLRLDSTKARHELGWRPCLGLRDALGLTIAWHQAYRQGSDMRAVTIGQIRKYQNTIGRGSLNNTAVGDFAVKG